VDISGEEKLTSNGKYKSVEEEGGTAKGGALEVRSYILLGARSLALSSIEAKDRRTIARQLLPSGGKLRDAGHEPRPGRTRREAVFKMGHS